VVLLQQLQQHLRRHKQKDLLAPQVVLQQQLLLPLRLHLQKSLSGGYRLVSSWPKQKSRSYGLSSQSRQNDTQTKRVNMIVKKLINVD